MNHLPRLIPPTSATKPVDRSIHFSPVRAEVAPLETSEVFARMKTASDGLSDGEAANRLADVGPNVVATGKQRISWSSTTA